MTPGKDKLDQLFKQNTEGSPNTEEQQLFWQWLFLLNTHTPSLNNKEEEDKVREEMRSAILQQTMRRPKRYLLTQWQVAAAVVLLATATLFVLVPGHKKDIPVTISAVEADQYIRSFYLPDSTHVMLNLASRLEWKSDFNSKERRVSLRGEAYFEVHKDSLHPFIVESNGLQTRALGTAFNIESYPSEGEVRVSLLHGKVAITDTLSGKSTAILAPGQLLRYNRAEHRSQTESTDISHATAWTSGGMSFNRIPLQEALDRLARRYKLQIKYHTGQLKGKTVSGSFQATSWEKILTNILFVHDLQYQVKDSMILIQ